MTSNPDIDAFLPLPPLYFNVLIALGRRGVLHGYGMIESYEQLTGGADTLLPGSLYASLARMVGLGLIEETEPARDEPSGGPKRRYYRLTELGRRVASAEAARQARMVELARLQGFAPAGTRQ